MKEPTETPIFHRPELIANNLTPITRGLGVKKTWVFCLNRKNRLVKCGELTSGTAPAALAHPREVFRAPIQYGVSAVACAQLFEWGWGTQCR